MVYRLDTLALCWRQFSYSIKQNQEITSKTLNDNLTLVIIIEFYTLNKAHSQLLALRYGTTCRLTSQLRHHSRSSETAPQDISVSTIIP